MLLPGVGEKTALKIIGKVTGSGKSYSALTDEPFSGKKYTKQLGGLKRLYTTIKDPDNVEKLISDFFVFYKPLMQYKYDKIDNRQADVESLITVASRHSSLEEFITRLTLEPPETSVVTQDNEDEKLVLSTIHSAKGLEWNTVFILSVLEGFLPDARSLDSKESIEEERRLFYVAATRAEDRLFLVRPAFAQTNTYSMSRIGGYSGVLRTSRFLAEIDGLNEYVQE